MCKDAQSLQRQHRTFWHKLIGIKEIYVCQKCGYQLKIR
jgi:rubrerythrin